MPGKAEPLDPRTLFEDQLRMMFQMGLPATMFTIDVVGMDEPGGTPCATAEARVIILQDLPMADGLTAVLDAAYGQREEAGG